MLLNTETVVFEGILSAPAVSRLKRESPANLPGVYLRIVEGVFEALKHYICAG
jgi:hypothetical protein